MIFVTTHDFSCNDYPFFRPLLSVRRHSSIDSIRSLYTLTYCEIEETYAERGINVELLT